MNRKYLDPAKYIDSDSSRIINYSRETVGTINDKKEQAIALYNRIRDEFRYNPYIIHFDEESLKASAILDRNYGHCIAKASLMAACLRTLQIPSRLGFVNVRNHIGVERIIEKIGTDVLAFHGYVDIYIEGKWRKATPAFNKELCDKYEVEPLEFNGIDDSIFQEYDHKGNVFMEYLEDHGTFHDLPKDRMFTEFRKYYPTATQFTSQVDGESCIDMS